MYISDFAQISSVATPLPMIAFAATLTTIIGVLGGRYWDKKRHYQPLESLPSPPKHWLLGNIPEVLAAVKKKQFFQLMFDWSQQYGSVYVYWVQNPVLVLSKPSVIESTITGGMRDGSLIRAKNASQAWNDIRGPIMIGQSGTEWQWRRKAWNPEFSSSGLSKYIPVVHEACTQITGKIKAKASSEPIPIDPLFVELTMRIIANLLLGIPINGEVASPEGPLPDIQKLHKSMSVLGSRFLLVAIGKEKPWMKYLPTKLSREYWSARRTLDQFVAPRVDLALQLRDNPAVSSDATSTAFQESMLVKIAAKEPRYTKETLTAEAVEMLIAGTDTTAHTLSFTVGELARHPEVFQKAQGIVDRVWQQHGSLSNESLKDLNYLRAIVKETLRLYSIASGSTSLQVVKPTVIEGNIIPPGTVLIWSMQGAGRDAETYAQPERFLPERWLEEGKGSPSLPMIDFGSGSHRCLGEHLAMLEATIMLAQLLRNFTWELVNGHSSLENLQQDLLIYPVDGMPLQFHLRETLSVGG